MNIILRNNTDKPIYEQICLQIKEMIISGKLNEDEALPSMRLLAKELKISVITTKRAYEELERDGFIFTVPGKGSFVATKNKDILKEHQLRQIEEHFQSAIDAAKLVSIDINELTEILNTLYSEGD